MATFSQYGVGGFSGEEICADESYIGALGAYQAMEESAMNDRAVFEFVLGCDFAEAATNNGMMLESDFEAINEASNGGIFSKVVDFFKKMLAKIKGIIQNAIDKLKAMTTKDGKELVNKFKKQINDKMNSGVYTDKFTFKWCKSTGKAVDRATIAGKLYSEPIKAENPMINNKDIKGVLQFADANEFISHSADKNANKEDLDKFNRGDSVDNSNGGNIFDAKSNKALDSDELKDYKDKLLGVVIDSSTDEASFNQDYDELVFEDEDTVEGLPSSIFDYAVEILTGYDKLVKTLEKFESTTDKAIRNDYIKPAEALNKKLSKKSHSDSKNYGTMSASARTLATAVISMGNVIQQVNTKYVGAALTAAKKDYKQSRALYIKAATYNKKKSANEAALLEAYVDVSNYEVDCMMPEC